MQPFRMILENAPDQVAIPAELRHQRVEIIFWPLEKEVKIETASQETPRQALSRILSKPAQTTFNALCIDTQGFHFNRKEANER